MITQIVRLRHVVKRWKNKSLKRSSTLCYSSSSSDTDESADAHPATPSGSVAVYVGSERRRFVIPTRFLNLPVFVRAPRPGGGGVWVSGRRRSGSALRNRFFQRRPPVSRRRRGEISRSRGSRSFPRSFLKRGAVVLVLLHPIPAQC
ncbi:auxin-induced protein 6b [Phtheirospermum japonicum]|uniref:Auxin-induced protein 6b n=1 Tax=Phtheirospermum japonicum TaxID=374723 RepID=A0A830CHJ7_9LAMI|nr:auxin-induced protein 6b [Phtheirospermum japonicum]